MKFSINQTTLQGAVKQRDLALWACVGLTVANALLALKVVSSQERWVLIPQYDTEHQVALASGAYPDLYYIDWAADIVNMLLCINPDSAPWKIKKILQITTQNYGTLKDQFEKDAAKLKQDQVSTAFYPKHFKVDQSKQTVDVSGQHLAYFGKDSKPVITEKTFRLTWGVGKRGLVLLKDFKELKDEH